MGSDDSGDTKQNNIGVLALGKYLQTPVSEIMRLILTLPVYL